jgi:uncharacterized damage-inducible protein DinB
MSQKESFHETWQNEYQTTLKVLKAYPPDKPEFKPHERSQTAVKLAWTLVLHDLMIQQFVDGTFKFPPELPATPKTFPEVISAYQSQHEKVSETLRNAKDSDLLRTLRFPVGPGDFKEIPTSQLLWMFLHDTIHHRGQLSVYVRMAGGKVPSIYGPSGDEPWKM